MASRKPSEELSEPRRCCCCCCCCLRPAKPVATADAAADVGDDGDGECEYECGCDGWFWWRAWWCMTAAVVGPYLLATIVRGRDVFAFEIEGGVVDDDVVVVVVDGEVDGGEDEPGGGVAIGDDDDVVE